MKREALLAWLAEQAEPHVETNVETLLVEIIDEMLHKAATDILMEKVANFTKAEKAKREKMQAFLKDEADRANARDELKKKREKRIEK